MKTPEQKKLDEIKEYKRTKRMLRECGENEEYDTIKKHNKRKKHDKTN